MKRAVAAKRSRDVVSELTIGANTKRVRRVSRREFSSSQLHQRFQQHVAEAQSAFLNGDSGRAEQEATLALRIRPTAHLFALLAVIAESKGHFDRASDLRLVQAFLAKDVVLWEELLHEFLAKQLFYKSVVCLQRLSSLEKHDGGRYRMLQLQLADLLIGLGEIRRATSVLTGKWSSLERLIVSSLQNAFSVTVAQPNPREGEDVPGSSEVTATSAEPPQPSKIRVSKRVRFFGVKEEAGEKTTEEVGSPDGEDNDEFDFDDVGTPTATIHHEHRGSTQESASKAIDGMYGEQKVALETPTAKRNFLTLINVHAELLNETGKFDQTVRLLEYASACLDVPMLELPPDLLVRLVTAYAYQGDCLQPCREVLRHLLDTCSMEEYADVLLDAAVALQKVGVHVESREVFSTLVRYYRFRLNRLEGEITTMESNLEQVRASHKRGNLEMDSSLEPASYQLQELRDETKELKTVIAAALYGSAQCTHSLQSATDEGDSEVVDLLHQALEMDPFNLRARLLLGELLYHNRLDLDGAIAVLTPRDGEPSLQRMQLGAELVKLFRKANKYVEAVALGVSLVELVLSSPEDGDTQSVAPGSSRRGSTMQVLLPTLSRASSAIVPATTLSGMLSGTAASQAGSRLTISLAASIRAGTSVYRQELARRGRSALTTTVYGASAAASIAAGWGREVEEEATKDSSTIFRFHRRRASSRALCRQKDVEDTQALRDQRRREVEAITTMKAENFWEGTALETIKKEENDDAAPEDHRHLEPDNPSGESREATVGPDPVTADLRSRPREVQLRSTDSTAGDRDQDLLDLEQFEATEDAESAAHEDDYLPSLEEVSRRFQDPMMAELFLQASTHTPDPQESSPADASSTIAVPPVGDALPDRVTVKDAVSVLGRHGLLNLAVTIVECYALLGKFTEAKEFAFVALTRFSKKRFFRQMGHSLERPLRLALLRAALASGESEDAYRVGIRLLQEDMTEDQRHEVLEILHGVLSRCEDRSSVLYRLFAEGHCDVPLLILLANRYYQTRSYTRVLNLYLVALEQRPQDIFLNFMVGLCYFLCSHQKKTRSREACISAGTHYFLQYQTLTISLDRSRTGEVLYNTARAMQFLRLHYACVPLYERVANQLLVPEECTMAVKRAAGINLYYFYRWTSSNRVLALNALPAFSE